MEKESQKDALIYDLRGVDYTFAGKFTALRSIELKVRAGERLAIVGANGCGRLQSEGGTRDRQSDRRGWG